MFLRLWCDRAAMLSGMLEKQRPQFHVAPFVKSLQVGEKLGFFGLIIIIVVLVPGFTPFRGLQKKTTSKKNKR